MYTYVGSYSVFYSTPKHLTQSAQAMEFEVFPAAICRIGLAEAPNLTEALKNFSGCRSAGNCLREIVGPSVSHEETPESGPADSTLNPKQLTQVWGTSGGFRKPQNRTQYFMILIMWTPPQRKRAPNSENPICSKKMRSLSFCPTIIAEAWAYSLKDHDGRHEASLDCPVLSASSFSLRPFV